MLKQYRLHPSYDEGLIRSEEHTSELQSLRHLVCRLLLEKKIRLDTHGIHHSAAPFSDLFVSSRGDPGRLRRGAPIALRHLFFFNDTATTEIYALSLHDALPI